MATVSFAGLNQTFYITENDHIAYSTTDSTAVGSSYSYLSTGSDSWEFYGTGITQTGGLLDGGTVTKTEVDLDDDTDDSFFEISISGLSVAAADFGIGVGTNLQQLAAFWTAALGGNDTFDITLANYAIDLVFAGDGAYLIDGNEHIGGDDSFDDGGTGLSGASRFIGDYQYVSSADAMGGDDTFTVGAAFLIGDFDDLAALWLGIGGDDVITPARLVDNGVAGFFADGDAASSSGNLTGGADLIDLRATDLTGFTQVIGLFGDVNAVSAGTLVGGDDTIHGSSVGDLIKGDYSFITSGMITSGGDDSLYGYGGVDTIGGNEGDDFVNGGASGDSLDGGAGTLDIVSYAGSSAAVSVNLGTNAVSGGDAAGDTIAGFEGANGSSHNDTLTGADAVANELNGSVGADSVSGLSGNDTLDGGAGNDTLAGGTGADSLTGGAGADSIVGGGSIDKVSFVKASAGVAVNLGTGMGTAGDALGDVISDVDILSGSNYGDTLTGGSGGDDLRGRGGSDSLSGGAGNDTLDGSNGNDTITGGAGNDSMTGGGHNDRFDFSGSFGADTISGFNAGTGVNDVIRLVGFGAAFDTFAEVLAATTDTGADCVINLGAGKTITLLGIDKTDLVSDDFAFAAAPPGMPYPS